MKEEIRLKRMDKFSQEVVRTFVEATNHVLKNVKFTAWNEQEMRALWRKQSLNEVLNKREVNHLFPCIGTAALAAKYLQENGENPDLILLTEQGAVDTFRKGRARALHIDSVVMLTDGTDETGLDIGSGDITLIKYEKPLSSGGIIHEAGTGEKSYLTTRPKEGEKYWLRAPFIKIKGKTLLENPDTPILDFLHTRFNLVNVPYRLTTEEFHQAPIVGKKQSFLTSNQKRYSPKRCRRQNVEWLNANKDILPGLREFCYE